MDNSTDVVIIGGGVIGSACAYFLTASDYFTGSVTIVERDTSYQNGSTARSVGGIRQQFSTPENIRMSQFAMEFLPTSDRLLAVNGVAPELPFTKNGYLLLATDNGLPVLESNVAIQKQEGATTELLPPGQLATRFPWLNTENIAAGSFGPTEGWTDPYALMQAFRAKARDLGATVIDDQVIDLSRIGSRISGVSLASGNSLPCGIVVNAAGSRARHIADMAELTLPVAPRKRFVFVFDCHDAPKNCPLTVDPTGVYFRPEGSTFICGRGPDPSNDPDCLDLEIDYDFFDENIWPVLAERVPAFEAIKVINAWAGTYAYNVLDQNALIGPHPEISNMIFANGFSGHGLQQSPAIGRAVSELILHGEYRTLDLKRFGLERIIQNAPLAETNVI